RDRRRRPRRRARGLRRPRRLPRHERRPDVADLQGRRQDRQPRPPPPRRPRGADGDPPRARGRRGRRRRQAPPRAADGTMTAGLGTDRFGVLTLAWMVLGYFSLFDLGLGRALTKRVAEELGHGREGEVPPLVGTALGLMMALGVVGGGLVAAASPRLVHDVL